MANCLKEAAECIVTTVIWPPLQLHIHYWWHFDGNVQGLRDEIDSLKREISNMEVKTEEARLRAEIVRTEVEDWLNEGTQKLQVAEGILQRCVDLKMWKIIPRYSVGKSAKETAEVILKLRNKGNSIRISDPAPPAAMVRISDAPTLEFQTRKSIEKGIMDSLKDGNVRMVAICGAGGVGKTTMAKRIEDNVRKENLFGEVVFVVVSQQIDILKIQKQIAEMLGCGLSEETEAGRAHKLRTRLIDSKEKLIIFDDVWERFDPKDVGVPYENGFAGCKIMLTSRLKYVCEDMEADKVIEVQVLDEKEAWTLFSEKSGDCVDDFDLRPIAEDVAKECKGLPIALVTVGRALKRKNIKTWKDALSQLRSADPTNIRGVLKDVYIPLKLSYDSLETTSEKDLFLLCCLFPEDHNIQIEDLALLSFGLGLFEGINNIEDGRNRTYHLVEMLKSRFLLMTGEEEDELKMHDVVRDVAIFIGSKEKHGFLRSLSMDLSSEDSSHSCNWMSVDVSTANAKLPVWLDFPNLHLLMILNSSYFEFPNVICFEGMKELRVLHFSNINLQSLPSSLEFLKGLRNLHLYRCEVKEITVVGELARLEILRVRRCHCIEELPTDVGKLKFLRLLELKDCKKLKRIVAGVISSLVRLEELKVVGCFDKWEAKGNLSEGGNASLSELECLPNLTSLEIHISNPDLVAEDIGLSQQLVTYRIHYMNQDVFEFVEYGIKDQYDNMTHEREINIHLPRVRRVATWIRQLVNRTQSLTLAGDGLMVKEFVDAIDCKFPVLEYLALLESRWLEMMSGCRIPERSNSFENLESPTVQRPPMLGYSWKSLTNLKNIYINIRINIRYLFPVAILRSLVQLERLEIHSCDTIEQVFWNEMESNTVASIIEFPKLKILKLYDLPNLVAFTQGVEIIKSLQLRELEIRDCPKLRTKIGIELSTFNGLHNLHIYGCDTIEEIFWNADGNRHIIFPKLSSLELRELPCLTIFSRGVESIKFPKLRYMSIGKLTRMNSILPIDSEPNHDHHSLHFFCNKKVEIIGLEYLRLLDFPDNISKIWCRHVPSSFFHSLKKLYVYKVEGIKNLISSSIAKALANLWMLDIGCCNGIVDVVEDEIHVPVNCVLPSLEILHITHNHKLRSFCQWKHAFELPSLKEVKIDDCPLMETFSLGSSSTPKLSNFYINHKETGMKDLNSGLHHFITNIANEDENEDEYDEDESSEYSAEDRKEIEGEEKTASSDNSNRT